MAWSVAKGRLRILGLPRVRAASGTGLPYRNLLRVQIAGYGGVLGKGGRCWDTRVRHDRMLDRVQA